MTANPLLPLRSGQAIAANPWDNAWVSASAGTGKTQVLTARVLRLLLTGAAPERLLCLTFTKAAAAEMQVRIFDRLIRWVRCDDAGLDADLRALGETPDAALRTRARRLFARVVDARGGLAVQTFHSFAQSLLAGFPVEAGITPGFSVLDDRTGVELRARVLTEALSDPEFADDVASLVIRLGEQKFHSVIQSLLQHRDGLRAIGNPAGYPALLRRKLNLPTNGDRASVIGTALAQFDCRPLQDFSAACVAWGAKTGIADAQVIAAWIAADAPQRLADFDGLKSIFLIKNGTPRTVPKGLLKQIDGLDGIIARICDAIQAIAEISAKFDLIDVAALHLRVGHRMETGYRVQKSRSGLLDFDDMIADAARMLRIEGMGEWVRFKLDERIDHILVDEGQDTNEAQWQITKAIADEFFAGRGAREEVHRTLFAVGDYKQSIFSFQGSDPRVFSDYRGIFAELAADAGQPFHDVPLAESFRSGGAILEVVDRVIGDLGFDQFGLDAPPEPHRVGRTGDPAARVTLWPPVQANIEDDDEPDVEADVEAEWLPGQVQRLARLLARQIRHWIDDPDMRLANGRRVRPEDILVLVRARGEFVGALVASLHAERVPVAGADRLRLTAPIAVQDCLALIRFALQPDDDLTLASLLTSPFLNWTQESLFDAAFDRGSGVSLWRRLRSMTDANASLAAEWLSKMLGYADLMPPYEFLETILSGELGGRAKLLARLGEEARDQVDALLAQALAFEHAHAPSLQGFLAWIENDEFDLKRDPDAPNNAVRVMTVHGAKGLQAPIVVLADAARGPGGNPADHVTLNWGPDEVELPIFFGGKAGRIGPVAEALERDAAAAREEHWRLLYVAMTRAEDMLFVGGALGSKETRNGMSSDAWHARIGTALAGLGATTREDQLWNGEVLTYARGVTAPPATAVARSAGKMDSVPDWARAAPAIEPVPPRPLSPSQLAADDIAAPPPTSGMIEAARKGSLLHKLFERLSDVAPTRRRTAAEAWLAAQADDLEPSVRSGLVDRGLAIVEDPAFADVFGPDALAEAPIAAVVDGVVIAGKVDRLLVRPDRVQVIDFKTGRHVPSTAQAVSPYYLKQMAAYTAALARIFPGRVIEAALLYTEQARMIELPAALLEANAPGTSARRQ